MSRPDASDRPDLPTAGHPDVDTLADFGANVLDEDAAVGIRRHIEACADCRARLASYDDVARLLHELPAMQMPADVLARLEDALREEAASRPDESPVAATAPSKPARARATPIARPLGSPSRWRRWRTGRSGTGLAGLAAAAAVVLLISGVIAGALHLRNGGNSHNGASGAAAGAATLAAPPHSYATTYSGADYTKASLAAAVPALVGSPPGGLVAGPAQQHNGAAGQAAAGTGVAPTPPLPAQAGADATAKSAQTSLAVMDPLAKQPAVLFACIAALTGSASGAVPLAVDIAHFDGQPAAVIVLPSRGHPADVEAWVVGPGCGRTPGNDVLYWQRVPRG